MARSFKLPDLGEGIHEAEIQEVLVSAGEEIEEGDSILVAETDKASVEIPSPYTGTVQNIEVEAGDLVRVGDVVMTFDGGEAEPETGEAPPEREPQEEEGAPGRTAKAVEAERGFDGWRQRFDRGLLLWAGPDTGLDGTAYLLFDDGTWEMVPGSMP